MSSRTVSVVLSAQVQNYLTNMRAAEAQTLALERSTRTATQQFAAHNAAVTKLGVGMFAVGATAAAGLAIAIKASAEFGAKMAQLQSLSHASAGTMKLAADAAMSVGTAYGFSATQVADAQIELQKAGIGIQAQLGGALKGALTLAAAGQMDVGRATEITTVAMTQFGLKASQVPHIADLLAAGADKALGSVSDLGEGLKNGGLQAANMGLSIDQTIGLLSAFANAGILGAEAGTQMRSMFLRLQNPTQAAKDVLDKYGISINDANGKFVGMSKFAGELRDHLSKLEPATRNAALATVFGSHAIVGATAIYNLGAKGVQGWNDRVNEAGFAAAQAAGKMNSLQGDTQKLAAVFQTDLINAGSGANDALRNLVQTGTHVLNVFGEIPAPIQDVAVTATVLTAGVGLLGGGFLIAVPKVVAFRAAITDLGLSMKGVGASAGVIGGAVAGIALLLSAQQKSTEVSAANTQMVTAASKATQDHFKHVNDLFQGNPFVGSGLKAALEDEMSGVAANNKGLDVFGTHIGDVYRSHEGQLSALGTQLAALGKVDYTRSAAGFNTLVKTAGALGDKTKQLFLVKSLGTDYEQSLSKIAKGIGVADTATNRLAIASGKGAIGQRALSYSTEQAAAAAAKQATSLAKLSGSGNAATQSISNLESELKGLGSTTVGAKEAEIAFQQAIEAATAAAAKGRRGLDLSTQAGQENQHVLDNITTSAGAAAAAYLANGGSAAGAAAKIAEARKHFVDAAAAMTGSRKEANKLADAMHLIPGDIRSIIKLTGVDPAKSALDSIKAKLRDLQGRTATVSVQAQISGLQALNRVASLTSHGLDYYGKPVTRAGGGRIDGPGPKGVDSVPAWLAPGEHVLTARDVDLLGGQGGAYAFRRSLESGRQHFAKGGAVGAGSRRRSVTKPKKKPVDLNGIHAQDAAADAAKKQAATAQKAIDAANRRIKVQEKAAKAAAAALSKAQDASAKISGKGTAAAKHAAVLHARDLSKKSKAAADRVKATQKTIDTATKTRDAAKQKQQDARAAATQLRQGSEDFVSTQRRATPDSPIDPLSYVDQLRSMSRDDNYSAASRSAFDAAANKYETSLVTLSTASSKAATKLTDLQNASTQMHDSITSSIAGGYTLSGAATAQRTGNWVQRDGIRYQTTSGGGTASSIAGYYQAGAGSAQQFADVLKQLAGRGLNSALLAELAGMGTDQGLPIAQAILSGSAADLQSINSGYGAIQSIASSAGTTVADANYAAQITAADANAQQITDEIATQGEALRKVIAAAFGLKGYAVGTRNATPGLHWVGEHGPELAGFTGGETVLTAGASRRWVRGQGGSGAAPTISVQAPQVQMPDTITVKDASGFELKMRVISRQEIHSDAAQDAVLMMGGAA